MAKTIATADACLCASGLADNCQRCQDDETVKSGVGHYGW
jgi:hypothetical protein